MKTYRNEGAGFEIDVPEDWSLPAGGTLEDMECLPDETIELTIEEIQPKHT